MFTHTSWVEDRADSYERLEFLGDSVLELAIARAVFDRFSEASEGRLAKVRAHVVSRQSCAAVAKELGLGDRLLEHAGDAPADELQRISRSRNVLAAVLEAAIAAVYLEHGFEAMEPALVEAFSERIEYARSSHVDYKTELQEALARSGRHVHYTVIEVEGPPHDRKFVCAAHVAGRAARRRPGLDQEGGGAGGCDAGARARRSRRSASCPTGSESARRGDG